MTSKRCLINNNRNEKKKCEKFYFGCNSGTMLHLDASLRREKGYA